MTKIIMGVDPGLSGAIAFLAVENNRVVVQDIPIANGEINTIELARQIRIHQPNLAMMENVFAMPAQGVVSMFNFGAAKGDTRTAISLCNVPLVRVSAHKWKRHFGLSSDKEECRQRAIQLFPDTAYDLRLKKHHGRAEAALIALYAAQIGIRSVQE